MGMGAEPSLSAPSHRLLSFKNHGVRLGRAGRKSKSGRARAAETSWAVMTLRHTLIAAPVAVLAFAGWSGAVGNATLESIAQICGAEQRPVTVTGDPRLTIEDGMGDGGFAIRTRSREAQEWFNYGIKLFHAFYHADNKVAFEKAVAADPNCALCLWGQALSRGPTQNFDVNATETAAALEIARKARVVAQGPFEIALTEAMVARYAGPQNAKAETTFAGALMEASRLDPKAEDIQLIAGEALLTAWRRGDKAQARPAMDIIEPILRREPNNTAAIHYYIHATEFAGVPIKALPGARKLSRLAPQASHLVHMAAHTFLDVGYYQDAAVVNADSLGADARHLTATNRPGELSTAFYYTHDLRFGMAGTLMSGDAGLGLRFADHVRKAYPARTFEGDMQSVTEGQAYAIFARYAPFRMLAIGEPAETRPNTRTLYHYGRGEAFAMQRDVAGMKRELEKMGSPNPAVPKISKSVLEGRIAMLEGRYDDAIKAFEAAAAVQDTLSTRDPPPFWYPVRRSVAAAHLKAGRFDRAAAEARRSLAAWPQDALALLVLSKAEEGLKQTGAARRHLAEARRDWKGDLSTIALDTI